MCSKINKVKIHDLTLFILACVYLLSILFNKNWYTNWYIVMLAFANIYVFTAFNMRDVKILLIIVISLIPIAIATFFTTIFYTHDLNKSDSCLLGVQLVSRMYVLVISSVIVLRAIDFEHLVLYCMQRLYLPVMIGYPLLSAINALKYFEVEALRIRNAYLMRFASKKLSILMLYSLLVSAARHAFHQGISMESRGLNANKTFVRQSKLWSKIDTMVLSLNIMVLLFFMLFY